MLIAMSVEIDVNGEASIVWIAEAIQYCGAVTSNFWQSGCVLILSVFSNGKIFTYCTLYGNDKSSSWEDIGQTTLCIWYIIPY